MIDFIWDTIKGLVGFLVLLGLVYFYQRLHVANETKTEFNIAHEGAKSIRVVLEDVKTGWADTTSIK
jgi:hypothetical protein